MIPSWVSTDDSGVSASFYLACNTSGAYSLSVATVDALGRNGSRVDVGFVVDLDPPTSSFTAMLPQYVNTSTLALGTRSEDALSSTVVLLRVDSNPWVQSDVFTLSQGPHWFSVMAVDGAGNAQPPPYDTVNTTVDTVPPVVSIVTAAGSTLPLYTRNTSLVVCTVVVDASPTVVTVVGDGIWLRVSVLGCASVDVSLEGAHTVAAAATDAAGNPSVAAATAVVVSDFTPPRHALTRVVTDDCVTLQSGTVCSSALASVFAVAVSEPSVAAAVSPLTVQWALLSFTSAATCSQQGEEVPPGAWQATTVGHMPGAVVPVVVTDAVAAFVAAHAVARFVLHTRVVDGAGNVGDAILFEWWVDTLPPDGPIVVARPDAVVLADQVEFTFALPAAAAQTPGVVSYDFLLFKDGVRYVLPGGNPVIADPAPTNDNPVVLSLRGLPKDASYAVNVWTRSQPGVPSMSVVYETWQMLSSPPSVVVLQRPDAVSGSSAPVFVFAADWGASGIGANATVAFQVQLLGDADLGTYHVPVTCDASRVNSADQRDCFHDDCSTAGCAYTVQLSQAKGTTRPYTLQVRTMLFSSPGATTTLSWSFVRCAGDQFTVFSGVDTVQCERCPTGGDCSGTTLPSDMLTVNTSQGAISTQVVVQQHIAAQSGFWASDASDGLTFYKCPLPEACLPGVNGTKAQCATGYAGVLCSVCDIGYFDQYGHCVLCPTSSSGGSIVATIALPIFLFCIFLVLFAVRNLAPRGMMKVGISMLQIVARCVQTRCMIFFAACGVVVSSGAIVLDRMSLFALCHGHCRCHGWADVMVIGIIIAPCWSSGVSHGCLLPSDLSPCAVPILCTKFPGRASSATSWTC